jgi:two-component system, response regulator YesN
VWSILVVDDEPIIARTVAKLLLQCDSEERLQVRTARHGLEAIQLMEEEPAHMVFTDIRMPVMDGIELSRRIQEQYPAVLPVVVSGYSDFEYAKKCMEYGVKEYLLKPPDKEDIQRVLNKLTQSLQDANRIPFSLTVMDQWADQLADAIWQRNQTAIDRLVINLSHHLHMSFSPVQSYMFVEESYSLVVKKLNALGQYGLDEKEFGRWSRKREGPLEQFKERIDLLSEWLSCKRRGNSKDPIVEAKLYIENHLADEADLEEVADMLGISPTYFSHLFRQKTGETFVKYRMKKRLEKAKQLLELPQYRVTDIAIEVGYNDPTHFSKLFKRMNGMTPTEYREKLGVQ